MEPEATPSGLGVELDRIEAAVDAGNADLRGLGFWRVVALIKRDDDLIERYADQVGRIDTKAFRARVRFRAPAWVGVALDVLALAVGTAAVVVSVSASRPTLASPPHTTVSGLALLVAAFLWASGVHSFAHFIVGRIAGIRFTEFFFVIPPPPLPGLKTDYATYLRTGPLARAWMHAAGAIATKLAPFVALAFAPAANAPWWAVALLVVGGVGQIIMDVIFSTKASDWKKVRRELAVARAVRRGERPRVS